MTRTLPDALPFSQACENNKAAILRVLKSAFAPSKRVLEIGSGTGQHAVYFATHLPHLEWQPSDRGEAQATLNLRLLVEARPNLLPAVALDISDDTQWPGAYDAMFSANTAHIMPWPVAASMIKGTASALVSDGVFALYGPFNYEGKYTSDGNAQFDLWLKERAVHQGIRDFEKVNDIAEKSGLALVRDHAMPANNRLLIWRKV